MLRFMEGFERRESIRRAAERVGVHPSTAFRWRHGLLGDWRARDTPVLSGRVYLDVLWLPENVKGRSPRGRPARRRRHARPGWIPDRSRVTIALAWERLDRTRAFVSPVGATGRFWLDSEVLSRLGPVELRLGACNVHPARRRSIGAGGLAGSGADPRDEEEQSPDPGRPRDEASPASTRPTGAVRPGAGNPHPGRLFRRWLLPFRGVATRYLENYLQWFRMDAADGRVFPAQHFPRTEAERRRRRGG